MFTPQIFYWKVKLFCSTFWERSWVWHCTWLLLKAIVCCRSVHKQLLSDRKSQRWQWFRYIRCISLQKSHQESQKRDRMHEHSNSRAGFCSAWGVWLDQGVTQRWEQCRQISSQREKNSRKSFHGKHSISSLKRKYFEGWLVNTWILFYGKKTLQKTLMWPMFIVQWRAGLHISLLVSFSVALDTKAKQTNKSVFSRAFKANASSSGGIQTLISIV